MRDQKSRCYARLVRQLILYVSWELDQVPRPNFSFSGVGDAAPAEARVVGMVLTGSQGCSGD